jgi:Protein of unknown function (DUF2917)
MDEKRSFEPGSDAMQGDSQISARGHQTAAGAEPLQRTTVMTTRFSDRPVRLNTGELLDIHDGEGFTVECLEGAVWITQSNDPRDIVLNAGETFVLDKPGLALVCAAAGPAALAVEVPLPTAPPLPPYRWGMRTARNLPAGSAGL